MTLFQSSIVITGMGIVCPLGDNNSRIVTTMQSGETAIKPVNLDAGFDLLMGTAGRDGLSFEKDLSADFAETAALDAWNQAGLHEIQIDPWRVATIIGSSKGRIGNLLPAKIKSPLTSFNPADFTGDTLGLQVARRLEISGPVLNYPAACATGIVCMIRGIQALQNQEVDIVLSGSAESAGRPLLMSAFRNMGVLSKTLMRPFHVDRDGFNPGEGGAVFVMEREQDARARGAKILARMVGWDQRSDASHATAAEADGSTIAYSLRRTLQLADWESSDVEYINAHGTGTRLNDLVESRAINQVFPHGTPYVSSIKPYMGHLLGASSAVELALVVACAKAGFMPGTLGLNCPDPHISLRFVPPMGKKYRLCRIIKMSLGFGGHIGVLALEIP